MVFSPFLVATLYTSTFAVTVSLSTSQILQLWNLCGIERLEHIFYALESPGLSVCCFCEQKDDLEAIPGYLSLHQSADSLTLKWTPNQLMNGTLGDSELEKRYSLHSGKSKGRGRGK